jgi:hypothetical protein
MEKRQQQGGAALILALAVITVAVCAWQQHTSLAQLFMAQHVLDQSVSAAALAASQHHARLLNGHAFLNRTIMAHQVAMAHLLTLASAEKMRLEMSRQLTRGNPPLFLIGMMFGPHHAAAYAASKLGVVATSQTGLNELHRAFTRHDRLMGQALQRSREQLLKNIRSDTEQLVHEVLARNMLKAQYVAPKVDHLNVTITMPMKHFLPLEQSGASALWRGWFEDVMRQHPYLQTRRDTARNHWMISKDCPHMRHELRRRGNSVFDAAGLWQATDSVSMHAVRGHKILLCYWREYPMGWANVLSPHKGSGSRSAHDSAYQRPGSAPDSFKKISFLKWVAAQYSITSVMMGMNNVLADGRGYASQVRWNTRHRVQPYALSSAQPFVTKIHIKQPLATLETPALKLGLRVRGLLQRQADWPSDLRAEAAAQAYYDRYAERHDARQEVPNLFQPFWSAKNIAVR